MGMKTKSANRLKKNARKSNLNKKRFEKISLSIQKSVRLQKAISSLGFASRREIETWINQSRILVNSQLAKLGMSISAGDKIEILSGPPKNKLNNQHSFRNIKPKTAQSFIYRPLTSLPRILLYHKPQGEIVSQNDPKGRPSVFTNLPRIKIGKWINVGRLDYQSSGLLLFTNNGELANKLMHPSAMLEREYAVRISGVLSDKQINQLIKGVILDNLIVKCIKVDAMDTKNQARNRWYKIIITEGRNREIRRLIETLGFQVSRLIRIRYGILVLPRSLRRGKNYELSANEVKKFIASVQ